MKIKKETENEIFRSKTTVKIAILSKLICRFSTSHKKIVAGFLQKLTSQS